MTDITRKLCVQASIQILILFLVASTCLAQTGSAATEALHEATRLAREGKYEEALQKHLWYHENAAKLDPSQSGVRSSFALAYWADLGKKYPKALDALKSVRDQSEARLLKGEGDWSLLYDVYAINRELGEPQGTVELFKKIDAANPAFAAEVYHGASRALVDAGEYALVGKYMQDPSAQLATAQDLFEMNRKLMGAGNAEKRFSNEMVRLITVLKETGDRQRALEIQAEALKVVDSPEIRAAVK